MEGLLKEYFCWVVYVFDKGVFFSFFIVGLVVGNGICKVCILCDEEEKFKINKFLDGGGFRLEGVEYKVGDYLYLDLIVFKFLENKDELEVEVIFKGGRNKGLWFFVVC